MNDLRKYIEAARNPLYKGVGREAMGGRIMDRKGASGSGCSSFGDAVYIPATGVKNTIIRLLPCGDSVFLNSPLVQVIEETSTGAVTTKVLGCYSDKVASVGDNVRVRPVGSGLSLSGISDDSCGYVVGGCAPAVVCTHFTRSGASPEAFAAAAYTLDSTHSTYLANDISQEVTTFSTVSAEYTPWCEKEVFDIEPGGDCVISRGTLHSDQDMDFQPLSAYNSQSLVVNSAVNHDYYYGTMCSGSRAIKEYPFLYLSAPKAGASYHISGRANLDVQDVMGEVLCSSSVGAYDEDFKAAFYYANKDKRVLYGVGCMKSWDEYVLWSTGV